MFTEYDVVVLIILLTSGLLALFRGFIREAFSFIAWVGAAVITFLFYPLAAELFKDVLKSSSIIGILAVTVTYFTVFFLLSGLNAIILDFTREVRMGPVDRSFGLLFGIFRGLLIVALIHYCVVLVHQKEPSWLEESEFSNLSGVGAKWVDKTISSYLQNSKERFGIQFPGDERDVQEKLDDAHDKMEKNTEEMKEDLKDVQSDFKETMDKKFTPDE